MRVGRQLEQVKRAEVQICYERKAVNFTFDFYNDSALKINFYSRKVESYKLPRLLIFLIPKLNEGLK